MTFRFFGILILCVFLTAGCTTLKEYNTSPTLSVSLERNAQEPSQAGNFLFVLSRAADSDLNVAYALSGTAISGTDYVNPSGFLTIPKGATQASLAITPIDDAIDEITEKVIVTVQAGPGYRLGTATATLLILDNEILPLAPSITPRSSTITHGHTVWVTIAVINPIEGIDYLWNITGHPSMGTSTLARKSATSAVLSYSAPSDAPGILGTYNVEVTVSDGTATGSRIFPMVVQNNKPTTSATIAITAPQNDRNGTFVLPVVYDRDGDALTFMVPGGYKTAHGEVRNNDPDTGEIINAIHPTTGVTYYYPELGYEGPDSFEILVSDGVEDVSIQVNVTVSATVATQVSN